jgi:hypothetical protein
VDNLNINRGGKDSKELFSNIITALNKIDTFPNLLVIDNAIPAIKQDI